LRRVPKVSLLEVIPLKKKEQSKSKLGKRKMIEKIFTNGKRKELSYTSKDLQKKLAVSFSTLSLKNRMMI